MTQRSALERELLDKANRFLPGGTLGNMSLQADQGFLIKEGRGSRVWDVSGNEYVDWLMGSGPMLVGHAHPAVVEAVIKAAEQGSTFFATNDKAVLLAEALVDAIPCAEQVRFTTSGSDACFQAMRIARAYKGREKVLKFEGGYHGTSDYAFMSVWPGVAEEFPQSVPGTAGIPKAIQDLMLIAPFNDLETTEAIIHAHHDELAAIIVEPLQRVLAPQPGFLQGLKRIAGSYDIPLIFDEVVTGFRLAYGGAQEFYGVTPDLCTVGKVMGGGYPLAAVAGRSEIMSVYDRQAVDPDDYVNQTGTLNGNPIACAAGLATLEVLRQPGVYEALQSTGGRVRQALMSACAENGLQVQMCGEDGVFDIYFTDKEVVNYRDTLTADGDMMRQFNAGLLQHGILKGPQKFYTSLAHTEADVERTVAAFRAIAPTLG